MYRPRSTDVWYNAPGVVAAYQPVAAPDAFAARQNVSNNARLAGRNTAMPGVAPTWSGASGWGFSATSSTYLTTGLYVTASTWSAIVRVSNATSGTWPFGCDGAANTSGSQRWGMLPYNIGTDMRFCNCGSILGLANTSQSGVFAFANRSYYLNGARLGTNIPSGTVPTVAITIGALNRSAAPVAYFTGYVQAFLVPTVTLSDAHVAQYSRQMAYCHANPEWSAWGRRRRYYYAPSEAASAAKMNTYFRRMRS